MVNQVKSFGPSRWLLVLEGALVFLALTSLFYAVVTAPSNGKDLLSLKDWAHAWLEGSYRNSFGPPPYLVPLISPLALLSSNRVLIVWLGLNLLATGTIFFAVVKLWGETWTLKAQIFLFALFISWAPFRVTLRVGQVSIFVTALALAALLAIRSEKRLVGGALLGLSLSKYSLTLPFLFYFIWKREWMTAAVAILVVATLTLTFALRLGMSPIDVTRDYINVITHTSPSHDADFAGTTEIGPLLFSLTGGNEPVSNKLTFVFGACGLIAMFLGFRRRPQHESLHIALVALYSLWFVYHRTYDSVLCIVPAALLVDFIVKGKFTRFSIGWLSALGLFVISLPGLLTERLHVKAEYLAASPLGLLAFHIERLLVLGLFCALMVLLWKSGAPDRDLERL